MNINKKKVAKQKETNAVDFSKLRYIYEYDVKKGKINLLNHEMPAGTSHYLNGFGFGQNADVVRPNWDTYELEWLLTKNHTHRRCMELKATLITGFGYYIRNKKHRNYKKLENFLKKPNYVFGDTFSKIIVNMYRGKNAYGSGGLFVNKASDIIQIFAPTNLKSMFVKPVKRSGMNTTQIDKFVQVSKDGNHTKTFFPYDGNPIAGRNYFYRFGYKTLQNSFYPEPEYLSVIGKIYEDLYIDSNNIDWFKNRARMDIVMVFSGGILNTSDETKINNYFQDNMSQFKGLGNQHKTMILSAGEGSDIKIHDISKNEDGQYTTRQLALEESIARSWGMMPSLVMLQKGGSCMGGGSVAIGDLFMQNQIMIRPEQIDLESDINIFLETLFNFDPQIKFRTIDTNNQKDMAIILSTSSGLGIIGKKEAREYIAEHGLMEIETDIMPDDLIEARGIKPNSDGDTRKPDGSLESKPDDINTIDETKFE